MTLRSHYNIMRFLGVGRSGVTYLAADRDLPTSSFCVIKNIRSSDRHAAQSPLIQKRFEIQTSIAYNVGQHPQIPTLIAKFEEAGDRYLVREYIAGESLSCELANGAWSQAQVLDFLIDVVGILCFVHNFKYIHQQIDPQHIIRRSDDNRFTLIGFSLVKDLDSEWQTSLDDERERISQPMQPCSYIPYEQEQNIAQFNSDLYAVGVIAIQALTGTSQPYRDPDSYEFVWRDEVNINLRLSEIIDRMVRPDYRDRYQSALEVLTDLQSFAKSQLPPHKLDRLKPYLIFGSTVCLLLLGFSAVKLLLAPANKPQLTLASTVTSRQTSLHYTDKTTGIKIEYPPLWHREDIHNIITGEKTIFTSPKQISDDRYRANVSIRVEKLTDPRTTLTDYTKSAIAEIARFDRSAKIIESSSVIFAKRSANLVIYVGKDENSLPIKHLEVWTIDRNHVYILTYKAEPIEYYHFLQAVMTMIDSFKIN